MDEINYKVIWAVIILITLIAIVGANAAQSHEWYDKECCSDDDCAPVEKTVYNDNGSITVTSKHGTVTIPRGFPRKPSKDEKDHVCILKHSGIPICYYATGGF